MLLVERIEAASIPAFLAPFNATVATGIPLGICKMERTESHPSIELDDFIGTPITGKVVIDATMPGRCAAPPAPAIITLIPRLAAVEANFINLSGVLCAETTVSSKAMPNSFNCSAAALIIGRSLSLPMMILTIGFFLIVVFVATAIIF